jgi:paraquat-inducible protein A
MHTEKLLFWHDDYSIIDGIRALVEEQHYGLALILFFFSMIFPVAKLAVLGALWFVPTSSLVRGRALKWLTMLGKWSMLDVFVVAVLIVITQLGGMLNAEARSGLYLFAAAIVGSMIVTHVIERAAKKERMPSVN